MKFTVTWPGLSDVRVKSKKAVSGERMLYATSIIIDDLWRAVGGDWPPPRVYALTASETATEPLLYTPLCQGHCITNLRFTILEPRRPFCLLIGCCPGDVWRGGSLASYHFIINDDTVAYYLGSDDTSWSRDLVSSSSSSPIPPDLDWNQLLLSDTTEL